MKESRFLELINSLPRADIEYLRFYVDSKLFNKNKTVSDLYNLILNFPAGRKLSELTLFEKLNESRNISAPNFRMVLTSFSNLIETYLIHKKINEDVLKGQQYLMKYAYDNSLQFLMKKTKEKIDSNLKNKIDLNFSEKSTALEYLFLSYIMSGNNRLLNNFQTTGEQLWQEVRLMKLNCLTGKLFDSEKKYLNQFSESKLKKTDLFLYYYYSLCRIKSGDTKKINDLKNIFEVSDSKILKNLISEYLINSENVSAQEQLKFALWFWNNSGVYEKNTNADSLLFIALQNYELDFSKKIIKYLSAEKGFFSKALYHFYFNDFASCLNELEKIFDYGIELNIKIRQLKLCCYLRLNQFKNFNNAYFAFKKFAYKNIDNDSVKDAKKFSEILFNIANNRENIDKLLKVKKLLARENISNKNWLENELKYHLRKTQ